MGYNIWHFWPPLFVGMEATAGAHICITVDVVSNGIYIGNSITD
jgi:hypothetical protein